MSFSEYQVVVERPLQESWLNSLGEDLWRVYQKGEHTDLKVNCKNTVFAVSKFVLSGRSSWFAKAVKEDTFRESFTGIIELYEGQPAIFQAANEFFYRDDYTIPSSSGCGPIEFHIRVLSFADFISHDGLERLATWKMDNTAIDWMKEDFTTLIELLYQDDLNIMQPLRDTLCATMANASGYSGPVNVLKDMMDLLDRFPVFRRNYDSVIHGLLDHKDEASYTYMRCRNIVCKAPDRNYKFLSRPEDVGCGRTWMITTDTVVKWRSKQKASEEEASDEEASEEEESEEEESEEGASEDEAGEKEASEAFPCPICEVSMEVCFPPKQLELRPYVYSLRCDIETAVWATSGPEFTTKCVLCDEGELQDGPLMKGIRMANF